MGGILETRSDQERIGNRRLLRGEPVFGSLRCVPVALALLLALVAAPLGCGDDTVIVFATNLGTIDQDATCTGGGGEFPLRQQSGLIVIVILSSDSHIFLPGGIIGTCNNLTAGTRTSVRGSEDNGRIHASEVHIL
jgi:hypothetical protein